MIMDCDTERVGGVGTNNHSTAVQKSYIQTHKNRKTEMGWRADREQNFWILSKSLKIYDTFVPGIFAFTNELNISEFE